MKRKLEKDTPTPKRGNFNSARKSDREEEELRKQVRPQHPFLSNDSVMEYKTLPSTDAGNRFERRPRSSAGNNFPLDANSTYHPASQGMPVMHPFLTGRRSPQSFDQQAYYPVPLPGTPTFPQISATPFAYPNLQLPPQHPVLSSSLVNRNYYFQNPVEHFPPPSHPRPMISPSNISSAIMHTRPQVSLISKKSQERAAVQFDGSGKVTLDEPPRKKELSTRKDRLPNSSSSSLAGETKPEQDDATVENEDEEEAVVNIKDGVNTSISQKFQGEKRLHIDFISLGELGVRPQRIGKSNGFVPDNVKGKFKMYHETFIFSIKHGAETHRCRDGVERICIAWTIVHEGLGIEITITESPDDAMRRSNSAKTICNHVFTNALENCAKLLEQKILEETQLPNRNDCRISHLNTMIKIFRPKHFSKGPLAFGLLHEVIQTKMASEFLKRAQEMTN